MLQIKQFMLHTVKETLQYLGKLLDNNQQCVAMSLCALIYSKIIKMTSIDDMTQTMIVGIQFYSSLSLPARRSMLMLTELPGMVTVFEQFFHLEYSTVTVILVTSMVIPELRGVTTVYATHRVQHLKHSLGTELQLIHFNGGNYRCWYLQH